MGILGRKRASKSTGPSPDGQVLLQRQLASLDPILRRLAQEALEAQNAAPGTLIAFPAKRPIKTRRNPGVPIPTWDRQSCRYCGRPGAPICERSEKVRTGFDTAQMSQHSIADWFGCVFGLAIFRLAASSKMARAHAAMPSGSFSVASTIVLLP